MAKSKSYKLLCPIARALDRIGDRWTLLILRDLHAGPMRFGELQKGLPGIAANLLTDRLNKLVADGLVDKGEAYALTGAGAQTLNILFELAVFGAGFAPAEPVQAPGSLRTVATTLLAAARRCDLDGMTLRAGFDIGGVPIQLTVASGDVSVLYDALDAPDVIVTTAYEDLLALSDGDIALADFVADRAQLQVLTPGADGDLAQLMAGIVGVLTAD